MQQQLKSNCRISVKERWTSIVGFSDPRRSSHCKELQFVFCFVSQTNKVWNHQATHWTSKRQLQIFTPNILLLGFFISIAFFNPVPLQSRQHLTACKSTGFQSPLQTLKDWIAKAIVFIGTSIKACKPHIFYSPDRRFLRARLRVAQGRYTLCSGSSQPCQWATYRQYWWVTRAPGPTPVCVFGVVAVHQHSWVQHIPSRFAHKQGSSPLLGRKGWRWRVLSGKALPRH